MTHEEYAEQMARLQALTQDGGAPGDLADTPHADAVPVDQRQDAGPPPMQTTPTNKGFSAISRGPLAFAQGLSDGVFGENPNRSPSEDMNVKARGNDYALGRTIPQTAKDAALQVAQLNPVSAAYNGVKALADQVGPISPVGADQNTDPPVSKDKDLGAVPPGGKIQVPPPPGQGQTDHRDTLEQLQRGYGSGPVTMELPSNAETDAAAKAQQNAIASQAKVDTQIAKDQLPVREQDAKDHADIFKQMNDRQERSWNETHDYMAESAKATRDAEALNAQLKPDHYWASLDTGQRIMGTISLMLGGAGSAISGQPNLAAEMLRGNIQRDTEQQVRQIELASKRGEMMKGLAGIAQKNFSDAGQMGAWLEQQKAAQTKSMLEYMAAKNPDARIAAAAQAAGAKLLADTADKHISLVGARNKAREMQAQANEADARAYQMKVTEPYKLQQAQQRFDIADNAGRVVDPETGERGTRILDPKDAQAKQVELERIKQQRDLAMHLKELAAGVGPTSGSDKVGAFDTARAELLNSEPDPIKRKALAEELGGGRSFTDQAKQLEEVLRKLTVEQESLARGVGLRGSQPIGKPNPF